MFRRNAPPTLSACMRWSLLLLAGALWLIPEPVAAQAGTYWTTNYYDVSGSSLREIRRSMRRNRPSRVEREGLTEWSLRARCGVAPLQGAYRCAGFNTTVVIRLTLPRWSAPAGTPDSVKDAWDHYITALMEHELGHAQFALSSAGELHRRVKEMGTDPSPDGLLARVEALVAQTTDEFKQREREYDRLTNHGLERGVMLAFTEETGNDDRGVDQGHHSRRHGWRGW